MPERKDISFTADDEEEKKDIIHDVSLTIQDDRIVVATGPN